MRERIDTFSRKRYHKKVKAGAVPAALLEVYNMSNKFSRRDFLKVSGVVVLAAAAMTTMTGCRQNTSVAAFGQELTAGKCKVTFQEVSGTKSLGNGGRVQGVTVKVENLGSSAVTVKAADFKAVTDTNKELKFGGCMAVDDRGAVTGERDLISIAAGEAKRISLWVTADSQPDGDDVKTITASATINGTTVKAVETKEKFKWGVG